MFLHRILPPARPAGRVVAFHFLVLLSAAASAQGRLDPVVVTGTREPMALSREASDIVVIDAATIRDSAADSVEDLLRRVAGLQVPRNGGPGQSAGYFIRGASTSGTLVFVDGVRIGSATLGQSDLEALSLSQIERIEVLRGPASSLYGADGTGGVIRIVTRRGDGPPRLTGSAAVGGYRSRQGALGVSGSQGAFDYAVAASRDSSRGVSAIRPGDVFGTFNPDRDGYARDTGQLRLGVTPAPGHRFGLALIDTRLNARFDSAEYDASFNPDPSPDFRNRLKTRVVAADYRGVVSERWTTTVLLGRSVDDLRSGGTTETRFTTTREQVTWQNAIGFAGGERLVVAYERLDERAGGDVFASGVSRRNDALAVGVTGRPGAIGWQADARLDDNSAYGRNGTARIGLSHELVPGLKLRALAGTTFRAPTFNDLYFPGFGVATVRPERGRSVEVGVDWQSAGTRVSATLYRNIVRDLIGYEPDPTGKLCPAGYFGCAANTSRARLQGATFGFGQTWGGFDAQLGVDLLDAVDIDTGQRLARRAAHQEHLTLTYASGPWSSSGSLVVVGARPDGGVTLGGYGVLDLRAAWRFASPWRLELKLLNALDHRVEPVRDYQGLGRQFWVGLRYDSAGF